VEYVTSMIELYNGYSYNYYIKSYWSAILESTIISPPGVTTFMLSLRILCPFSSHWYRSSRFFWFC